MLFDPETGREITPAELAQSAAKAAKALKVERETLAKFKKVVDDTLSKLDSSSASDKKVSELTVPRGAYGQGFSAADEVAAAYAQAHDNLKTLSKALGDQLTALGIAVDGASRGYQNVDEDQMRRLRAVQAQTQTQYDAYQRKHQHHAPGDTGHYAPADTGHHGGSF